MIIRKVEVNENRALAKLHMQVMPDFFLASLGEGFLTTYYKVVLRHPETICLLAEDENKNILGFVLGREKAKGYLKRILKSSLFTFVIEGIKLLFIKPKSLIRLVRNLDKISKDSSISDTQNYAEIGLIGVSPELKGLEAERFGFLEDSEHLSENEKKRYKAIISLNNGMNTMNEKMLISSLQVLSQLLYKHFGKKVIILIDEYDVPLDKAFQNGFYREMVSLIRGLFGMALKTNDSLQFAVLTGCMRISKESIFTGLNNFEVLSILNDQYDESFGFTDAEVKKILNDYNFKDHYLEVKEWYDGYHFGNTDIYVHGM